MCKPKVPNGGQVPNDPGHMNPTLDGTCTQAAGMTTCESGVCDPADDKCGLADGDGLAVPGGQHLQPGHRPLQPPGGRRAQVAAAGGRAAPPPGYCL